LAQNGQNNNNQGQNNNNQGGGAHGAPAPLMGAGLPVLLIGGGIYWILRRKKGQARFHNGLAGLLTYFDADAKGLLPASSCLARQAHSHAVVMPALKSKHRGTS
jgi:hypothetical protein